MSGAGAGLGLGWGQRWKPWPFCSRLTATLDGWGKSARTTSRCARLLVVAHHGSCPGVQTRSSPWADAHTRAV
jgi:hypothetical protein